MTDDAAKSAPAAPKGGPLAGIDAQRDAAKWLVAALAAVAAILVAGSQLSSIGEVDGWRLALAVGSAIAGLAAVAFALRQTFRLMLPSSVTLEDLKALKADDPAAQYLAANASVFQGRAASVAELDQALRDAYKAEDDAVAAMRANTDDKKEKALEEKAKDAIARRTGIEGAIRNVREHARWARHEARTRDWEKVIVGTLIAAGLSIVLFAWAANPPDDDDAGSDPQNLRGIRLEGVDLSGRDLSNLDFLHATFVRVVLIGAETEGADFSGVTWDSVTCVDGRNSDDLGDSCDGHLSK